jgi:hypothetical protein
VDLTSRIARNLSVSNALATVVPTIKLHPISHLNIATKPAGGIRAIPWCALWHRRIRLVRRHWTTVHAACQGRLRDHAGVESGHWLARFALHVARGIRKRGSGRAADAVARRNQVARYKSLLRQLQTGDYK